MTKGKTALVFYDGVNEIGGNKILLKDKETRVFLDFGQSFTTGARSRVQPVKCGRKYSSRIPPL